MIIKSFGENFKKLFALFKFFQFFCLDETNTSFMGMGALIGKFFIDLANEMIFKFISHDFIVAYSFDDDSEIFEKIIKKMLFLNKQLIIFHHKICYFLSCNSDSILFIDIVEN